MLLKIISELTSEKWKDDKSNENVVLVDLVEEHVEERQDERTDEEDEADRCHRLNRLMFI